MTTAISNLQPGTPFRLACNGRTGVLLSLTPGAAAVQYGVKARHVVLPNGREFDAATSRPCTISLNTEVEVEA